MRLTSYGQTPSYYHDATLDTIASGMVQLHNDLQGQGQPTNNDLYTHSNKIADSAAAMWSLSTNPVVWAKSFTNGTGPTNSLTYLAGVLNQSLSNALNTNFQAMANGFTNNAMITTGAPSATPWVINLGSIQGHSFTMDMSAGAFGATAINKSSEFATFQWWVRTVISAFVWLGLFIASMSYLQGLVSLLLGQRQLSGQSQQVMGTNAALPTGYMYAIVLSSLVVTIIGMAAAKPVVASSFFQSVTVIQYVFSGAGTGTVMGHDMGQVWSTVWAFFVGFVPIPEIIIAFFDYLAFRFLYGWALFTAARGIVLWFMR